MQSFQNARVFISGGAGVIGRCLVERLHSMEVRLLVGDLKPRPIDWPEEIEYWQGDLNTISPDTLEQFGPDYYFHLAATFERSEESYDFWEENDHHNIRLSHYLMTCLKDVPSLKKIVFASSYLIYDPQLYQFDSPRSAAVRLREDCPIYPRNLCGSAKLHHERELDFLNHFKKNQYTSVSARIFRVYGKGSRDIVSRWIRMLLESEARPLTVYRKEGMFDYIYADEVAQGLLHLAASDATGVVNLGRDNARPVADLLAVLKRHFPAMQYEEAPSDIPYEASQADMGHFLALTGWTPCRDLEDVVPEMIAYEKQLNQAPQTSPSR